MFQALRLMVLKWTFDAKRTFVRDASFMRSDYRPPGFLVILGCTEELKNRKKVVCVKFESRCGRKLDVNFESLAQSLGRPFAYEKYVPPDLGSRSLLISDSVVGSSAIYIPTTTMVAQYPNDIAIL